MIQEGLSKGSLEGVNFHFEEIGSGGGRAVVLHKYVGSNKVDGEDLGGDLGVFKLNVFTASKASAKRQDMQDSYFDTRDALINVLKTAGAKKFTHPTMGIITVMLEGRYNVSENVGALGIANFTFTLVGVSNQPITEETALERYDRLNKKRTVLPLASAGNDISSNFNKDASDFSKGSTSSQSASKGLTQPTTEDLVNETQNSALNSSNSALESFDKGILADFVKSSRVILDNISDIQKLAEVSLRAIEGNGDYSDVFTQIGNLSFLNTGSKIGEIGLSLGKIFEKVESVVSSPNSRYSFFKAFQNYNDAWEDKQPLATTSSSNLQAIANEKAFQAYIQNLSASYGANALVEYDFSTQNFLDELAKEYLDRIEFLLDLYAQDSRTYNFLQQIRVSVTMALENSKLVTRRVETVTVTNSSLSNLCYAYYGNLDLVDDLQKLNEFNNPSNLNGDVLILVEK